MQKILGIEEEKASAASDQIESMTSVDQFSELYKDKVLKSLISKKSKKV